MEPVGRCYNAAAMSLGKRSGPGVKICKAKSLATRPIVVGSGSNGENIGAFLQYADGVIVGSSLKKDGVMQNPVDVRRMREYLDAVRAVREATAARR